MCFCHGFHSKHRYQPILLPEPRDVIPGRQASKQNDVRLSDTFLGNAHSGGNQAGEACLNENKWHDWP